MAFDSHRATPGFGGSRMADKCGANHTPVMGTLPERDRRPASRPDALLVAVRASHHRPLEVALTDIGGASPVNRTYEHDRDRHSTPDPLELA